MSRISAENVLLRQDGHAFLVLRENLFAYTALMQPPTDNAGSHPNPITICGPPGVGKSLLVKSYVRYRIDQQPEIPIVHLTGAQLIADLAEAATESRVPQWQRSHRSAALFICEDLHPLASRKEAQQHLQAAIDEVDACGGQVVLTALRLPGEINGLSAKLVNRCHGGLCATIDLPGPSSRRKLLDHFLAEQQLILPEAQIDELTREMAVSPRELRAIVQELAVATRGQPDIPERLVRNVVNQRKEKYGVTLPDVAKAVAKRFGVGLSALRSGRRLRSLVLPRQTAMLLARELTDARYAEIGEYFGGRNHSTVVHACQRVRELLETTPELASSVDQVRTQLVSRRIPAKC
ncbi:MAG: helix-turn-helix domain-containing protein [Maioricimonas sp. JB049]